MNPKVVQFDAWAWREGAWRRFVLEIKGGLSRRYGVEAGDTVRFENISLEGIKD